MGGTRGENPPSSKKGSTLKSRMTGQESSASLHGMGAWPFFERMITIPMMMVVALSFGSMAEGLFLTLRVALGLVFGVAGLLRLLNFLSTRKTAWHHAVIHGAAALFCGGILLWALTTNWIFPAVGAGVVLMVMAIGLWWSAALERRLRRSLEKIRERPYTAEQWRERRKVAPKVLFIIATEERLSGSTRTAAEIQERITKLNPEGSAPEEQSPAESAMRASAAQRRELPRLLKAARNGKPDSRMVNFEFGEPWELMDEQGEKHFIPANAYLGGVRMTPRWESRKGEPSPPLFTVGIILRLAGEAVGGEEVRDVSPLFQPANFSQALLWSEVPEALKREDAAGALFGPVWIEQDGFQSLWRGMLGGKEVELPPGKREHGFSLSVRADGRTLLCRVFGLLADPGDFRTCLEPFCFQLPVEALVHQAKIIERITVEIDDDGNIKTPGF